MAFVVLYIDPCPLIASSTIENTVIPSCVPLSPPSLWLSANISINDQASTQVFCTNAVPHVFGLW